MGCYDTIEVFGTCPYSKLQANISCQTKDLGCMMFTYHSLSKFDDGSDKFSKTNIKMRTKLPVFPKFPLDKSHLVWKNQRELILARATVHKDYRQLDSVEVIAECYCRKCLVHNNKKIGNTRYFRGKIKIEKGKLKGKIYDLVKE